MPRRVSGTVRLARGPGALFFSTGFGLLLLLVSRPVFGVSDPPIRVTGRVMDLLGQGIPGVEVLAFAGGPESVSLSPDTFRTDAQGRFNLSDLNPGRYLIALNKPGYQILLAQINTRIRSRLSLTLLPHPTGSSTPDPDEKDPMEWVLRTPRTDALKEIEAPVPAVGAPEGERQVTESVATRVARLPLNGEVQQWFTSGLPFEAGGSDLAVSTGRATALNVFGVIGERGDWRVRGLSGTLSTNPNRPDLEGVERDAGADRLRVTMQYRLGPEDSLKVQARYDRDRVRANGPSTRQPGADQEVRTLGYQADWFRQAGEGQGLEMNLGFLQALGRLPEWESGQDVTAVAEEEDTLQDRRWSAGAVYGFDLMPEHRLSVRARTRFYRHDQRDEGWILAPVQPTFSWAEAGERGWCVSLSGEDAWRISNPVNLTLGLDYHRAESLRRLTMLVPHLGVRREGARSVVEGAILMRLNELTDLYSRGVTTLEANTEGGSTAGYRLEAHRRIGDTWTIGGRAQQNPFDFEPERRSWDAPVQPVDSGALFLMDPAAGNLEVGVQVKKRFKGIEGRLESDRGKVVGRVASRVDDEPIQVLQDAEIRYLALKASASVERSDTEVRLDYHRLRQKSGAAGSGEDPFRTSRLDLVLLQQVPFLGRQGTFDWKFLLAFQDLNRDLVPVRPAGSTSYPERVRRLSGGIGVTF